MSIKFGLWIDFKL